MKYEVPIWEKYCLTLDEAAAYFGIGINKLREMTDDSTCTFVVFMVRSALSSARSWKNVSLIQM